LPARARAYGASAGGRWPLWLAQEAVTMAALASRRAGSAERGGSGRSSPMGGSRPTSSSTGDGTGPPAPPPRQTRPPRPPGVQRPQPHLQAEQCRSSLAAVGAVARSPSQSSDGGGGCSRSASAAQIPQSPSMTGYPPQAQLSSQPCQLSGAAGSEGAGCSSSSSSSSSSSGAAGATGGGACENHSAGQALWPTASPAPAASSSSCSAPSTSATPSASASATSSSASTRVPSPASSRVAAAGSAAARPAGAFLAAGEVDAPVRWKWRPQDEEHRLRERGLGAGHLKGRRSNLAKIREIQGLGA